MKRCRVVQMICLSRVLPVVFVVAVTTVWFIYNLSLTCVIFFSQTVILFKLYPCFLLTFCYISMLGVFYKHNQAAPKLVNQLHFNHRCSVKIPEKVCFKVNGNCYISRVSDFLYDVTMVWLLKMRHFFLFFRINKIMVSF